VDAGPRQGKRRHQLYPGPRRPLAAARIPRRDARHPRLARILAAAGPWAKLFFCQVEALETLIYLAEAAEKSGDAGILNKLREGLAAAGTSLFRQACKMATGSGNMVVMGKVIEEQVGRLKVLLVRMNPDLAMGDDMLKKTGASNLFLVFGEPDVVIEKQKGGQLVAEVRGVDVFDPTTTGETRSSGPEDIACWFLDTDYDGESFFARHAYFLGGQEPYEKLKRALRAEVDEAEWSRLYAHRSVPFHPPVRGKVAVKVINHYGDEVLKVCTPGLGRLLVDPLVGELPPLSGAGGGSLTPPPGPVRPAPGQSGPGPPSAAP
jgi:hypothetical protein